MFFSKKTQTSLEAFRELVKRSFQAGGYLRSADLKKFTDADQTKDILNGMIRDGVVTVNVISRTEYEYMFPAVPRKLQPLPVQTADDFFSFLSEMGKNAEDGQVFLSEIIFAFDMEYSDIIDAFEIYAQNTWVTKNISKSGNVYLMFEKNEMQI